MGRDPRPIRARWERALLVALSAVAVTFAGVAYAAVYVGGEASGADGRLVRETVLVQSRQAQVAEQVSAAGARAGTFRRMAAEADVLQLTAPEAAAELRAIARSYAGDTLIGGYLTGDSLTSASLNRKQLQAELLSNRDFVAVQLTAPERSNAEAARLHRAGRIIEACAVALALVVVLLTLARLAPTRARRLLLVAASMAVYGAAVAVTAWQLGSRS
jgi:hypothetical protein